MDQIQITKQKLIIVEGNDDKLFFEELVRSLGITDVQVHSLGGKSFFTAPNFNSIKLAPDFRQVQYLIVIRDADEDAKGAFQSVCSILTQIQLPVPASPLTFTNGTLKVGILVVPPKADNGKLEDVCLSTIDGYKEIKCIKDFFCCLKKMLTKEDFPKDLAKAEVQAFLSSRKESVPHLGVAATRGYFPLTSPALNEIKSFLSQIA